jgi:hypothetical protein
MELFKKKVKLKLHGGACVDLDTILHYFKITSLVLTTVSSF